MTGFNNNSKRPKGLKLFKLLALAGFMIDIITVGAIFIVLGHDPGGPQECTSVKVANLPTCLTSKTGYANPTFWLINATTVTATGICTTSATYVEADNANSITVSGTFPNTSNQHSVTPFVFSDFDIHVTILGTSGKISMFGGFGVGTAVSREMLVSSTLTAGTEESGAVSGLGTTVGVPGVASEVFGLQILRTAGTGQVCLDDFDLTGYMLATGGSPL